jgi:hypothetical protein
LCSPNQADRRGDPCDRPNQGESCVRPNQGDHKDYQGDHKDRPYKVLQEILFWKKKKQAGNG